MSWTKSILSLFFLLPAICSAAAEKIADEKPMTLNECLIYARFHAHSNRIKRLEVQSATAQKHITASDLMPYLGLGSSASLSFGRNIDPETNTYDNKKTLGSGMNLELSLPLFDGLVRINNLKASIAEVALRKKEREVEEDQVSLEVIKNFFNISYCTSMVDQMQRQLGRDSTDLAAARMGLQLGTKSGADVAELEAIVAADLYELANQRNLLKKAYLKLRSSMGMPHSDSPLPIAETPIEFSQPPVRSKLPEIEAAELAVKQSRFSLRAAKGAFSPKISFSAGLSTSYYRMMGIGIEVPSFSRQVRDNMGEYLGISFSFPVFDGLASKNRVSRAKIALAEKEVMLEQTRYQIQQATDEAYLDLNASIEELSAAARRLEAEQLAYNAMRRRYELGAVSAIDLYTSSSKLAIAEANLVGKSIQRTIAEITLRYYQGYPLISEN